MKKTQVYRFIICFIIVCMALTACKKDKDKEEGTGDITEVITATITPTPTVTPTLPVQNTVDDQTGDTEETDAGSNNDPEVGYISAMNAEKLIQDAIDENGYFIEQLENEVTIGENTYYIFQIISNATKLGPNVLVNKISGELLCYYEDESTKPFTEFPLNTQPSEDQEEDSNEFTKEDALVKLSKLSAKTLGLPVKLTEYTIVHDDWTTNVKDVECYGIGAFADLGERMVNMGIFYVAVDGSAMYKFDSQQDDFVVIE